MAAITLSQARAMGSDTSWLCPADSSTPLVALPAGFPILFEAIIPDLVGSNAVLKLFEEELGGRARRPRVPVGRDHLLRQTGPEFDAYATHSVCWRWMPAFWDRRCGEAHFARRRRFRYRFHVSGSADHLESGDLVVEWQLAVGRAIAGVLVYVGTLAAGGALLFGHPHLAWTAGKITRLADMYAGFENISMRPEDLPEVLEKAIQADGLSADEPWLTHIYGALSGLTRAWGIAGEELEVSGDRAAAIRRQLDQVLAHLGSLEGDERGLADALGKFRGGGLLEPDDDVAVGIGASSAELKAASALLLAIANGENPGLERLREAVESLREQI